MKRKDYIKVALRQKFLAEMDKYLCSIGAKPSTDGWGGWHLDTVVGELRVTPDACDRLLTLFGRFADVERARAKLNPERRLDAGLMNPHSGKYNLHMSSRDLDGGNLIHAVAEVKRHIERVLPPKEDQS